MNLVFNHVPVEDEIAEFLDSQGSVNFNSLISYMLSKSVGRAVFGADKVAHPKVSSSSTLTPKRLPGHEV